MQNSLFDIHGPCVIYPAGEWYVKYYLGSRRCWIYHSDDLDESWEVKLALYDADKNDLDHISRAMREALKDHREEVEPEKAVMLAEELHDVMCTKLHPGQCLWAHHLSWEKEPRATWLNRAKGIVQLNPDAPLDRLIEIAKSFA